MTLLVQMVLPAVHQLVYTVQQSNMSGSDLLQLLHQKVTSHLWCSVTLLTIGCTCLPEVHFFSVEPVRYIASGTD